MLSDSLTAMAYMGDGEVRRKNRHGIAKDQEIASVENPFLPLREMIQTEETLQVLSIFFTYVG
jgi:hypothetical protein